MRIVEKLLRCNLWNVPQVKFHKIHLFKILHSAKYTFLSRSVNAQCLVAISKNVITIFLCKTVTETTKVPIMALHVY